MPLLESEAIVLRSTVFGEADKLVSFLTRQYGRLRGVAPSARKSRRRFGPALEPLTHVRAWFFEREHRETVRLQQCELIESFWNSTTDYNQSIVLNHVVELCEYLLPEREVAERAFRLTLMTLRTLRGGCDPLQAVVYYQLWQTRLAGWLPDFSSCSRCRRPLGKEAASYIPPGTGGFFCSACRPGATRKLTAAARSVAQRMLSSSLNKVQADETGRASWLELERYLLDLIEAHGEHKLVTRELLDETKA